jgi:hypothetical protein
MLSIQLSNLPHVAAEAVIKRGAGELLYTAKKQNMAQLKKGRAHVRPVRCSGNRVIPMLLPEVLEDANGILRAAPHGTNKSYCMSFLARSRGHLMRCRSLLLSAPNPSQPTFSLALLPTSVPVQTFNQGTHVKQRQRHRNGGSTNA